MANKIPLKANFTGNTVTSLGEFNAGDTIGAPFLDLSSPPAIGGTYPAAGKFTTLEATGNTTLGDASGDTLTINGTAVSIPNNLNFDSNTLFIDAANNNVGIGTSSPVYKVHAVRSGGGIVGRFDTISDGITDIYGYGVEITRSSAYIKGSGVLYLGSAAGYSAAVLDASGNLGLGVTPDNSYNACLQLKSGITFPATQVASSNANTLDDYEEGTFTPRIYKNGTEITSLTASNGRYVKIGKTCYVSVYILKFSGTSASGGSWEVTLPFTTGAINYRLIPAGYAVINSSQVSGNARWQINPSQAVATLYSGADGDVGTDWTAGMIEFSFSGTYETAD